MSRSEIGSMEDYVRLNMPRAADELGAAERKLAEIRAVVADTIYSTPSEALKGAAKILHIIDGV